MSIWMLRFHYASLGGFQRGGAVTQQVLSIDYRGAIRVHRVHETKILRTHTRLGK